MTTQKTDKKKVLALKSTVVSCKDASTNVKTSRTTTSAWRTWPPFSLRFSRSAMTILILSGLVKILHDDKCLLYAITLGRAAHTPRRAPETWARGATLTCSDKKHAHSLEEKRCGKRPRRGGVWADDLSLAKTPQYTDEQRGHAGISPRRFFL